MCDPGITFMQLASTLASEIANHAVTTFREDSPQ